MGLSKITVNVGSSGLGRRPLNKDKISGLLFFNNTLPAGFSVTDRVKKVYSLAEAEALGIVEGSVNHDVNWYHISEFFRMNPEGELWIGFYAVPASTYDFTEIASMLIAAAGEIRQLGIYAQALAWADTQVDTIQSVLDGMDAAFKQESVLYACNMASIASITGWAAVTDLRTKTARKVTVVIAESGSGKGKALASAKAFSITALGTALGALSKAGVHQSIGNPANFNLSNGTECEIMALANGDLISALSLTTLGGLKDKGYLIARNYQPDISGSFFERCPTAISSTNDYAWIEVNRMVDKTIRGVRSALIPQLNGTVALKSDGTLTDDSVGYYQDLAQTVLDRMIADGEISAGKATVDPEQDILGTSQLLIAIQIVPIGIAEEIVVNIGLTTQIS
jgi:hypothetical protein